MTATLPMANGHSAQPRSILYSTDGCPWAHRTRIAAKATGLNVEIVEIDLKNKPKWYLEKINPAGKVPTLWYDAPADADPTSPPAGSVIVPESSVVVDLILDAMPGKVTYGKPALDAYSHLVAYRYNERVHGPWNTFVGSSGSAEDQEKMLTPLKAWIKEYLDPNDGDYVKRKECGKGDVLMAPFVTRIFKSLEADIGAWDEGVGPQLYKALTTEPTYQNFFALYKKLDTWSGMKGTINIEEVLKKGKANNAQKRDERRAKQSA